ncbi:hypothetical protein [Actinomycetospora soli]|uniref:hypothetical protein n=1 Tax=Actinomycetospora soli TaxID=2893887 RepID=UPI001E385F2E|nr:hypothetical protein [Actinomycetospora soli]MCD2191324.1 hypothetical protein [Actinomycetospora soli]
MNTQTTVSVSAAAAPRRARGPSSARSVEWVVQRVVALLEDHQIGTGPDAAALEELAVAARRAGLGAHRERALLAGGTAELLITSDDDVPDGQDSQDSRRGLGGGVAVVVADHGATDALRGRLRRLGAHREIAAVVVATTRPRHCALSAEVRQVPVHVVVFGRDDRWRPGCATSAGAAGGGRCGGGPG